MSRRKNAILFDQKTGELTVSVSRQMVNKHGRVATLVRSKDGALKVLFADGTQAVYEGFASLPAEARVTIKFSGETYHLSVKELLAAAEHAPHLPIGDVLIVSGDRDDVAAYIGNPEALREGGFMLSAQQQGQTSSTYWSVFGAPEASGTGFGVIGAVAVLGGGIAALSGKGAARDTTPPAAPTGLTLAQADDTGFSNTDRITATTSGLTITGQAEANARIELFDGGNSLGTAVADASGTFSLDVTLASGTHSITAKATDAAGNVSAASASLSITVDGTAPAAPTGLDLAAADDTGSSNSDNVTSQTSALTITGAAEANARVELFDGTTSLGTATADGSGNFSLDVTLASGTHSITAKATDAAGNVSAASASLSITVDGTAPAAPTGLDLAAADDTGSSNSDNVTSQTSALTITGAAEANARVELFDGTTSLGTATADGSGNFSLDVTLASGTHSITAKATDAAGNVSVSSSALSLIVDTSAPSVPSIAALAATGDTTPTITGTAEANSTVKVYDGATLLGTTTANGSGNWSFTPTTALSEGTYSVTATATDAAGNTSGASSAQSLTIGTELLIIPVAGPFTGNVTANVYGQNGESLGQAILQRDGSYKITVLGYTGPILVVVSDNDTAAEYIDEATGSPKDLGAQILRAMDYMPLGNHTVSVTPLTELAARVAGVGRSNAVSNDQLTYNQKVGKIFGVEAITSVAKTILDSSYNEIDGITAAERYGKVLATLSGADALTGGVGATLQRLQDAIVVSSDGELNLHHRAVELLDQATKIVENGPNHSASAWSAVNVQASLFVEISGGANDGHIVPGGLIQPTSDTYQHVNVAIELLAAVQSGDEVTITWTWADGYEKSRTHFVTDAEKSAGLAKVTFDANGLPGQASSFDISRTGVDVKVTARVSHDGAVVQSNVPLLIDIYLAQDYIPSVPEILSLDADVGTIVQVLDGGYCVDVTPTLRGRASAGSLVNIYDNGVMISSVIADGNGQWTYALPEALSVGSVHRWTASSTLAGVTSQRSDGYSVTIVGAVTDTTAPEAPSVNDLTTEDPLPVITGSAEPGATVEVYHAGSLIGKTLANANGAWSFTPQYELSTGSYALTAFAIDAAGNQSAVSAASVLTISASTPPPTPSITRVYDNIGPNPGALSDGQVSNDQKLLISGQSALPGAIIRIFDTDALVLGEAVANADGTWSFQTPALADGSAHVFTARVVNALGVLSAASSEYHVTIDTTAPATPTVTALTTNDPTPVVSGTAEAGSTVAVTVGGATYTVTANGSGQWSVDTGTATPASGTFSLGADGAKTVSVTSTDAAGNSSSGNGSLTLDSAPTQTIHFDSLSFNTGSASTTTLTPTPGALAGAMTQLYPWTDLVVGTTYILKANGVTRATATYSGDNTAFFNAMNQGVNGVSLWPTYSTGNGGINGTNYFAVTERVQAGGDGDISNNNITLVTEINTLTSVTDTDFIVNVASGLTLNATLDAPLLAGERLMYSRNGSSWTDITSSVSGTAIRYTDSGLTSTSTLNLKVVNAANQAGVNHTQLVTIDTAAPATPTVAALTTNDPTPVVSGTAEAGSSVAVTVGGATWRVTANGSGQWSVDTGTATPASGTFNLGADGAKAISLTSTDAAGNASSGSGSLTLDTAIATPTVAALTTNDTTPVVSGTAEAGSTVTVTVGNATYRVTANGSGQWSVDTGTATPASGTFNLSTDGAKTVNVTSTDAAGNSSSSSGSLTLDTAIATPTVAALSTNDTTPVVSGTAEAGSTVTVAVGGATYRVTANGSGQWSVDSGTATPSSGTFNLGADGAKAISLTSTDAAGNASSGSGSLTLDTVAPTVPVISAVTDDVGTLTGALSSGARTDDPSLVITGTCEAGSTVKVYDGSTLLGTATVSGTSWTYTATVVDGQSYAFKAQAVDAAGNASAASANFNVTGDTTGPSAAPAMVLGSGVGLAPTGGTTSAEALAGGGVLTVTGEVGATVTVTFTDGSGHAVTKTVTGNGSTPVPVVLSAGDLGGAHGLADGTITVGAMQTDTAGNVQSVAASAASFTLDTSPPAAAMMSLLAHVLDGATRTEAIDANGIGSITAEAGVTVTLVFTQGANTLTKTVTGNGSTPVPVVLSGADVQALGDGTVTVAASATDAAGNAQATATPSHSFVLDGVLPVATLQSPTDGQIGLAMSGTIALAFNKTVHGVGEHNIHVFRIGTPDVEVLTLDAKNVVVTGSGSSTVAEIVYTGLQPGAQHYVTVDSGAFSDAVGNVWTGQSVTGSAGWDFQIADPAIGLATLAGDDRINALEAGSTVTISGHIVASAPSALTHYDAAHMSITLVNGGTTLSSANGDITGLAYNNSTGAWSATLAASALTGHDGAWTVQVTALGQGGFNNLSASQHLQVDTVAPVAPTLNALVTHDNTPVLSGTAEPLSQVHVTINYPASAGFVSFAVVADASGHWQLDTGIAAVGNSTGSLIHSGLMLPLSVNGGYSVTLQSTDAAGNSTNASGSPSFTLDTTPPGTPTVAAQLTNDPTPVITGTAEANSALVVVVGGATYNLTANGSGAWSLDTGSATPVAGSLNLGSDGAKTVAVTSSDAAGNASSASGSITLDQTGPAVSALGVPANATYLAGQHLDFSLTLDEAVIVNTAGGTPRLAITLGSSTVYADYLSGSGTTTLNFRYTVTPGDLDTDGIAVGTLQLNGGTLKDAVGNNMALTLNSVGATTGVRVDAVPPTANLSTVTDNVGAITGALASGAVTDDTSLVITGTCEAGSTVNVYNGSTLLGAATVSGTGWSYTATVADGVTYAFNAKETDAAGNVSAATSSVTVTGDTTAPAAPGLALGSGVGLAPSAGATSAEAQAGTGVVTVTGEAGAPITVTLSDGTHTVTKTVTGNGATPVPVVLTAADLGGASGLADGTITVSATQRDGAGNVQSVAASTTSFTLDTAAPAAPTVAALSTNDTTPVVSGTAEAGSTVAVTVGGATYTVTTDGSGQWSVDTGSATATSGTLNLGADGAKTVTVTSTDAAGNATSGSGSLTLDTTAPAISSVTVPADATYGLGQTLDFTVNLTEAVTVLTAGGTPRLALDVGGTTVYANYLSGSGSTALVFRATVASGLADADGITVSSLQSQGGTLRDAVGNDLTLTLQGVAATGGVRVDTLGPTLDAGTAPTVAASTIAGTAGNSLGETLALTVTFDGGVYGLTSGTASGIFTVGGSAVSATWSGSDGTATRVLTFTIAAGQSGQAAVDEAALKAALLAGITDVAGNAFTYTANGGVIANIDATPLPVIDTAAPGVTITDDEAGTGNIAGGSISYTITFDEAVTGFTASDVTVTNGSKGAFTALSATSFTVVVDPTAGFTGNVSVAVGAGAASDAAGNASTTATSLQAVDMLAPTATVVTPAVPITLQASGVTGGSDRESQIVRLGSGGAHAVVWTGNDGADDSIYVQVFNDDGTTTGNTAVKLEGGGTGTNDTTPRVSVLANGEFVVTWTASNSVYTQKFTSAGATTGSLQQLDGVGSYPDTEVQVTGIGSSGQYVVVWKGQVGVSTTQDFSIFAQSFDASGNAVDMNGATAGTALQLDAKTGSQAWDQEPQVLALGTSGNFVVAWSGIDATNYASIQVQQFTAAGATVGSRASLNLYASKNEAKPSIAAIGNDYVVAFEAPNGTNRADIGVQRFTGSTGALNGGVTTLQGAVSLRDDYAPNVTGLPTGGYVVAWYQNNDTTLGNNFDAYVQAFNASGTAVAGAIRLAQSATGRSDLYPVVTAVGTAGDFVVAWQVEEGSSGKYQIYVQKYSAAGTAVGARQNVGTSGVSDTLPQIQAVGTSGEFVVTWTGVDPAGGTNVYDQAFNADASPKGAVLLEKLANTVVSASSSETGTVYLVNDNITVTNLASITGAADNQVNSLAITAAGTGTPMDLTGLLAGNYHLYAVDGAGNIGLASREAVVIQGPSLHATTPPVTATTGGGNSLGDTIALTLTFNTAVSGLTSGTDSTVFTVGGVAVSAAWSGTNGSTTRVLTYTVAAGQGGQATIDEAALKAALVAGIIDAAGNGFTYTANSGAIANIDSTPLPVVDTLAPAAPTVVAQNTIDTTPTITGTAEANASVAVYDGSTLLGTVTADGSGHWSFTPASPLAGGLHPLAARASDAAGNVSDYSAVGNLVIDTSAPDAPFIQALTTNDTTPTITGFAEAGATVEVFSGSTSLGTGVADSEGRWSVTSSQTLASGTQTVTARATDTSGLTGATGSGSLTIDTTGPAVTAVAFGTPVGAQGGLLGVGGQIVVTVTFDDATYVTAGTTAAITLDLNGTPVQAVYASGSGTNTLTFAYTVQAGRADVDGVTIAANAIGPAGSLVDGAGNAATLSHGAVSGNSLPVDGVGPSTTVTAAAFSVDNGPSASDLVTNTAAQTVSGTLSANLAAGERVQVSLGAAFGWADATASVGSNTWSLAGQTLSGSGDTLRVRVVDALGNESTVYTHAWTLDTAAPTISAVAFGTPLGRVGDTLSIGDTVKVTVDFTQAVTVTGAPTLALDLGGQTVQASLASGSGTTRLTFQYVVQAGDLDADGISVAANSLALNGGGITDLAGNAATLAHAELFPDTQQRVDAVAPTAQLSGATDDLGRVQGALASGAVTDDASVLLNGTCESGSTVAVYNGDTLLGTATVSGSVWTFALAVADGTTYRLHVVETDAAGNVSAPSSDFTLTGDRTAPGVLNPLALATDTGFASLDGISSVGSITIDGLEAGASWEYNLAGNGWVSGTGNTLTLPAGSYAVGDILVRQVDAAGNLGAAIGNLSAVVIDNTAPTLAATNAADGGFMAPSDNLLMVFSERVRKGSGNLTIHNDTDGTSTVIDINSTQVTVSGNIVTINPTADLLMGKAYHVTVDATALVDLAGNAFGGITNATDWNFTVPDPAISLNAIAGNGIVNGTENAATVALGGTITTTAYPAVIAQFTQGDITVTLTPQGGGSVVTATVVSYNTGTGVWSATVPANTLVDGKTYSVSVSASHGGYTPSTTGLVSVDLLATAPTATLAQDTGSSGSDWNTSNGTIAVGGIEAGGSWDYSTNGGSSYSNQLSPGQVSFNLAAGTYGAGQVVVKHTDLAGNITTTALGAITVDSTAPTAPTVAGLSTASTTPTVSGTATLAAGETLSVTVGGATYSNVAVSGGAWSIDLASATPSSGSLALAAGSFSTVQARVTDLAGNSSTGSGALTISGGTPSDVTAPTLATTPLPSVSLTGGGNSVSDTITVTLNFSEPVRGLTGGSTSGVFTVGGTPVSATWGGTDDSSTRTLTYTVASGQNGQAAIDEAALKAALLAGGLNDAAGNALSIPGTIANIDSTALPVVDGTAPTFVSAAYGTGFVQFTFSEALDTTNTPSVNYFTIAKNLGAGPTPLSKSRLEVSGNTVTVYLTDSTLTGPFMAMYSKGTTAEITTGIQDAKGNDLVNLGAGPINVSSPLTPADTTPPTTPTAVLTTDGTQVVLQFNETMSGTLPAASAFSVNVNGTPTTPTAVARSGASLVLTLPSPVTPGTDVVTVSYTDPTGGNDANAAQDTAGNDVASFGPLSASADTTPPAAPGLAVSSGKLQITGVEAGASLKVFDGATDVTAKFSLALSGSTWVATPLQGQFNGAAQNFTVRQTDAAGNQSAVSTAAAANLDSTPDAPTVTGGLNFSGTSTTLTGTSEAGASVRVSLGSFIGAATADSNGLWTVIVPKAMGPNILVNDNATATATVTATNPLYNYASAGTSATLSHDTLAPTAAVGATFNFVSDTAPVNMALGSPLLSDHITKTAVQTVSGTYTGTLGAGEAVQVKLNNGSWVNATVDTANHTWSIDRTLAASFGTYINGALTTDGSGTISARVADLAGNASTAGSQAFTLDTHGPKFTSTALTAKSESEYAWLNAGDTVEVTVSVDDVVYVNGTPTLKVLVRNGAALNTIAQDYDEVIASYLRGSGSNTLVFGFSIGALQNDTLGYASGLGIAVKADSLVLTGGAAIQDGAGNNVSSLFNGTSPNASYKVDNTSAVVAKAPSLGTQVIFTQGVDIPLSISEGEANFYLVNDSVIINSAADLKALVADATDNNADRDNATLDELYNSVQSYFVTDRSAVMGTGGLITGNYHLYSIDHAGNYYRNSNTLQVTAAATVVGYRVLDATAGSGAEFVTTNGVTQVQKLSNLDRDVVLVLKYSEDVSALGSAPAGSEYGLLKMFNGATDTGYGLRLTTDWATTAALRAAGTLASDEVAMTSAQSGNLGAGFSTNATWDHVALQIQSGMALYNGGGSSGYSAVTASTIGGGAASQTWAPVGQASGYYIYKSATYGQLLDDIKGQYSGAFYSDIGLTTPSNTYTNAANQALHFDLWSNKLTEMGQGKQYVALINRNEGFTLSAGLNGLHDTAAMALLNTYDGNTINTAQPDANGLVNLSTNGLKPGSYDVWLYDEVGNFSLANAGAPIVVREAGGTAFTTVSNNYTSQRLYIGVNADDRETTYVYLVREPDPGSTSQWPITLPALQVTEGSAYNMVGFNFDQLDTTSRAYWTVMYAGDTTSWLTNISTLAGTRGLTGYSTWVAPAMYAVIAVDGDGTQTYWGSVRVDKEYQSDNLTQILHRFDPVAFQQLTWQSGGSDVSATSSASTAGTAGSKDLTLQLVLDREDGPGMVLGDHVKVYADGELVYDYQEHGGAGQLMTDLTLAIDLSQVSAANRADGQVVLSLQYEHYGNSTTPVVMNMSDHWIYQFG